MTTPLPPAQTGPPPKKPSGAFIKLNGLPLNVKLLTIGGYLAVFGLLLGLLAVTIGKDNEIVSYTINNSPREISLSALAFSGFGFILGWAYLITGAAAARGRLFLPALALLALQMFLLSTGGLYTLVSQFCFFAGILAIYALTSQKRFWRDWPLLHFLIWLPSTFILFFLSAGMAESDSRIAEAMSANFAMLFLAAMGFWAFLGLGIVDLGVGFGKAFTVLAHKLLPSPALTALTIFTLLVHPAAVAILFGITLDGFWLFDYLFSIPLILAAIFAALTKRWTPKLRAILMALNLASPAIIFGLSLAFAGYDLTEWLLNLTGIFPPLLLFIGLTIYNLMSLGVKFTSIEGQTLNRVARILIYFGLLILAITFMLFQMNEKDAITHQTALDVQTTLNNALALGALALGIPYLGWLIWKKREDLIGAEAQFSAPPRWTWLERLPARFWLPLSLILSCLACCTLSGILYWLMSLQNK